MLPEYPEARRRAFARNVLENTLRAKRGENLIVDTWSATLPWAESTVLEARILGARPMLILEDESTLWKSVAEAATSNVRRIGGHEWAALKACNLYVYFYGPLDTEKEASLPGAVVDRIDADDNEWFRIVQKYGLRCVRWDLGRTSETMARRYGVELDRWRNELIEGASVDPRTLQHDGVRIARAFRRGREVTISHPNGTDLTLRLRGRAPRVDDGVVDEADIRAGNVVAVIPSGVTTVAVDETHAEGAFIGSAGIGFVRGTEFPLRGGNWTFRAGRLVHYTFEAGGEKFRREFGKIGPGKDRPGLLAVGLNPKITSIPQMMDQVRGMVTIAIGRNSFVGGVTRTPRFTAYQFLQGATLDVDGARIVEGGKIT